MSAQSALDAAPPVAASEDVKLPPVAALQSEAAAAVADAPAAAAVEVLTPARSPGERAQGETLALAQGERQLAVERIRASQMLPPAMRDCLARVVEARGESAGGQTRVPVEDLVRAVEEAVPEFLRFDRRQADAPEHPAGDAFFASDPRDLSDREAEEIARGQLARSGLLRGQRTRTGD